MKNMLNGFGMFLQGLAVVISLIAGAVILVLVNLWENLQKLKV